MEEPPSQFIAGNFKVLSNISKDAGQRAHFDRVVVGNREVMLAMFVCGQPQVAPVLAGNLVTELFQQTGEFRPREVSW
jgi:hypothetical protein